MPPLSLYLALYVEGNSDMHFLPALIRRAGRGSHSAGPGTVHDGRLSGHGNESYEMRPGTDAQRTQILEAARCAAGYSDAYRASRLR